MGDRYSRIGKPDEFSLIAAAVVAVQVTLREAFHARPRKRDEFNNTDSTLFSSRSTILSRGFRLQRTFFTLATPTRTNCQLTLSGRQITRV